MRQHNANYLIRFSKSIGIREGDSENERLQKQTLVMLAVLTSLAGAVWGGMYAALGLLFSASIPFAYSLLNGVSIFIFHKTGRFHLLLTSSLILMLFLPFFLQWSVGGFAPSGAVMIWAILTPMGALMFQSIRHAIAWFIAYIFLTILSIYFEHFHALPVQEISSGMKLIFFGMNIVTVSSITFSSILYFVSEQSKTQQRNREFLQEIGAKNAQLERLSTQLAKYLSPQVYRSVFLGKEVRHETYRKKLSVFFSDIKDFTEITDSVESEALAGLLNSYLNEMAKIALAYGGTIDKFMGDAIMVFFGDPETQGEKEDALRCVRMAIAMRNRMAELRQQWTDEGFPQNLHVRMGINSGFCTVGNFGSEDRMDYTIIGGQVNIASRLETNAEPGQILISHETYSLVKEHIMCKPMGEITVKGLRHPVKTYAVAGEHLQIEPQNGKIVIEETGVKIELDLKAIPGGHAVQVLRGLIDNLESDESK